MAVGAVRSVRAVSVCPQPCASTGGRLSLPLAGAVYIAAFLAFFVAFLALSVAVWCNTLPAILSRYIRPFLWIVKT